MALKLIINSLGIKGIARNVIHQKNRIVYNVEGKECKRIVTGQQRPIYHIHIRKTAGTTINYAFLSNANVGSVEDFYETLSRKPNGRIIKNSKVFVGWNKHLINEGRFSYGFSHTPIHQLKLKPNIFLFTCLRDPVKRVISHYNMLKYYQLHGINHPCMKTEGKWLGHSILDFVNTAPKEHILNQLYMFSKNYSVEEAVSNLRTLNKVIFTESLNADLKDLESVTKWDLPISNQKKYGYREKIKKNEIAHIRDLLSLEYDLIDIFKSQR